MTNPNHQPGNSYETRILSTTLLIDQKGQNVQDLLKGGG